MICNVWTVFPIDCGKCSQVFIIHNWSVQRLADLIYGTSSKPGIYRTQYISQYISIYIYLSITQYTIYLTWYIFQTALGEADQQDLRFVKPIYFGCSWRRWIFSLKSARSVKCVVVVDLMLRLIASTKPWECQPLAKTGVRMPERKGWVQLDFARQ